MNALSWFLIAIDVYSNLKVAVIPVFLILTIGWIGYAGFVSFALSEYYKKKNRYEDKKSSTYYEKDYVEEDRNIAQATAWFDGKKWWPTKGLMAAVIFSAVFWVLTPSVNTLYLVASSEAAEMVVFSEEGRAVLQDLREILDAQLEALKNPG